MPACNKVISNGLRSIILHGQSVVDRYGHCTFQEDELLGLFSRLLKVAGQQIFTTVSPEQQASSAGPISLSSVKAPSF